MITYGNLQMAARRSCDRAEGRADKCTLHAPCLFSQFAHMNRQADPALVSLRCLSYKSMQIEGAHGLAFPAVGDERNFMC